MEKNQFSDLLQNLFTANHEHWRHFSANIRHFNSSFAFGSVKATKWGDNKKDKAEDKAEDNKYKIEGKRGAFVYRICGSIYRHFGATERLSDPDNRCFGQLYFIKVDAAVEYRITSVGKSVLNRGLVWELDTLLRRINTIAQSYKMMKDICNTEQNKKSNKLPVYDVRMVFEQDGTPKKKLYEKPQCTEVAAVVVGDSNFEKHTIIVEQISDELLFITQINALADAFCYPLFFPHGETTWHPLLENMSGSAIVTTTVGYSIFARTGKM
jgi:hypothetical protein